MALERQGSGLKHDSSSWQVERVEGAPSALAELTDRVPREQALFCTPAWYTAWAAAYLGQKRWEAPLRTLLVRDSNGVVQGALPLATMRVARLALPAGAGFYQPHRNVLVARERSSEIGGALADALADLEAGPGLRLGGVSDPDLGVQALLHRLRARGWAIFEATNGSVYTMPVPATVAAFEATISKRLAQNTRYYERKMQRDGSVEHRLFNAASLAEWDEAIGALGTIEERSWMSSRGGDMRFSGAENVRFWRTLLADSEASRAAHAFVLYFEGSPVSFVFALDSGGTRFVLANQYDEAVQAYRTGSLLYRRLILDAIEKGRTLFHLGRGDSGYKALWGAQPTRAMRDYVACRPTVSGRALFAALTVRQAVSQLRTAPHTETVE